MLRTDDPEFLENLYKTQEFIGRDGVRYSLAQVIEAIKLQLTNQIREDERRVLRWRIEHLDWKKVLYNAVIVRSTDWQYTPVLNWHGASDAVLASMLQQADIRGLFGKVFNSQQQDDEPEDS